MNKCTLQRNKIEQFNAILKDFHLTMLRSVTLCLDVPPAAVKAKTKGMQLLARYSYKSNPNSPLGKELNMKPGDRFVLKEKAEMWWLVQNSEGEEGFVPASYMVVSFFTLVSDVLLVMYHEINPR